MMDGSDMFADRLRSVRPSMILGLVQKARTLQSQGHPVIDLRIGEPDFKTSDYVKDATVAAIAADQILYSVVRAAHYHR